MRLSRKNRTYKDIGYVTEGPILNLVDNYIKLLCRINDEELDYLCEVMNDNELDLLLHKENLTYTEKKQFLMMLENHLACMKLET
mgnify:CR=1 FL=1